MVRKKPYKKRNPAKGYRLGKVERDESSSEFMHDSYIDAAPTAKIRVRDAMKQSTQTLRSTYEELPEELLRGSEFKLGMWSAVIKDSCLIKLAHRSMKADQAKIEDIGSGLLANVQESIQKVVEQKKKHTPITKLYIPGAEQITDKGLSAIIKHCPAIQELDISKASKVSDACIWKIADAYPNLKVLNIAHVIRACNAGLARVGQNCTKLEHLNLSGCKNIPEWVFLRIGYGCRALKSLDLSFCPKVGDHVINTFSQSCQNLEKIVLKGCSQFSDTGLISISEHCDQLMYLDITRWEMQYKITDMGILGLSEKCKHLETCIFNGCEFISDVGINWLATGCLAITRLELVKCHEITDIGLRSMAENLSQLTRLKLFGCQRVTDLGIRHLGRGCPHLETLEVQNLIHLSDGPKVSSMHEPHASTFKSSTGLASIALGCRRLHTLNLTNCLRLKDFGVELVGKCCVNLKILHLRGCSNMTTKGLLGLVHYSQELVHLDVQDTAGVNDHVLHMISQSKISQTLATLNLKNAVEISNHGIKRIAHSCGNLTDLNVSGCLLLGDYALLALAENQRYPGLRALHVAQCVHMTESGISWIAERCPMLTTFDLTQCQIRKVSLVAIQDSWKYCHFRHDRQYFGMKPNARAQDVILMDEYGSCWNAAVKIQSLYRAKVASRVMSVRREEALIHWTVTRLQSIFRGKQSRRYATLMKMKKQSRDRAARTIQSHYRHYCHDKHEKVRLAREYQLKLTEMTIRIQSRWRSHRAQGQLLARKVQAYLRHEHEVTCARMIQRSWRQRQGRQALHLFICARILKAQAQEEAATVLQSLVRGRAGRRAAVSRRHAQVQLAQDEADATLKIQQAIRCRQAQAQERATEQAQVRLETAAVCIQQKWKARHDSIQYRLLDLARTYRREVAAALKLQSSWRRKQGQLASHFLRHLKQEEWLRRDVAARQLQRHWRGKVGRDESGQLRAKAFDEVLQQARFVYLMATRIQACWRGMKGRVYYQHLRAEKKQRWKEILDPGTKKHLYYNQDTGEIRYRMPQDMLDLIPKSKCQNCLYVNAMNECKECGEFYCEKCFVQVHSGGKRQSHAFRTLYDYYHHRIDYGEGEWPSKWPSEIEQDEYVGWFLRITPHREPQAVAQHWEEYHETTTEVNTTTTGENDDDDTSRRPQKWYYNKKTKESTYDRPVAFLDLDGPEWVKYYDPESHFDFYYNTRKHTSTFDRPENYESEEEQEWTTGSWEKYYDEDTQQEYYYNVLTFESTYDRPLDFATPREENEEESREEWKKYYDADSQMHFYYNHATNESTYSPPPDWIES